jgi:hypothetical protein
MPSRGAECTQMGWARRIFFVLVCAAGMAGCATAPNERSGPPLEPTSQRAAPAPKRSPLREPPGVFFDEVTQANISSTICVSGWTATVRPSTSFTGTLKLLMLSRARLRPEDAAKYELDHYVPLALGGHPRSEDNLWLQPWEGTWTAKLKDRLERKLQLMVCASELTLQEARSEIKKGWRAAYRKFIAADPRAVPRGLDWDEDEVVE